MPCGPGHTNVRGCLCGQFFASVGAMWTNKEKVELSGVGNLEIPDADGRRVVADVVALGNPDPTISALARRKAATSKIDRHRHFGPVSCLASTRSRPSGAVSEAPRSRKCCRALSLSPYRLIYSASTSLKETAFSIVCILRFSSACRRRMNGALVVR